MGRDISDAIIQEVEEWKDSTYFDVDEARDINNNYCKQFAKSISDLGYNITIRTYGFNGGYQSYAHAWIEYNGRHYDSECPDGVSEPKELPLFQRGEIDPLDESEQ